MITIHLITFFSKLNKQSSVYKSHETMLSDLEKYFTVKLIDSQDTNSLTEKDFKLVFIATGGVEQLVIQRFEELPQPMILLTDGIQNSLASALEISAWMHNKGLKSEILHGDIQTISQRILTLHTNFEAQRSLQDKRVGVLGVPSTWLVASSVDYLLAKRRWGIEFTDIPLERVHELFDRISNDEVKADAASFNDKALGIREASPRDLINAMRLYKAIKQICKEENLDALTLSCFRIINKLETTGCLALSLLNDEGIVAGCEGDLQSIFTLLTINAVTGQTGFMANPVLVNTKTNEIVLAHCSIGTKMTDQFIIRNHFESDSGVAIQGILPEGDVTIIKCGGECLDEFFVSSGTLVENTSYINTCRTQVRVRLDNPADYFLRNPMGNHHILIQGNYESAMTDFLLANGCKRIS